MNAIACPSWFDPATWGILLEQHEKYASPRGGIGLDGIAHEAHLKGIQYVTDGAAYARFSPGNGTTYQIVLLDLIADQARYLMRQKLRARGAYDKPWEKFPDIKPKAFTQAERTELYEACRVETVKRHMGPSAEFGGELLVAFPRTAGRTAVFSMSPLLTVEYVMEKLKFNEIDALPVSEYLTLFMGAVETVRREYAAGERELVVSW